MSSADLLGVLATLAAVALGGCAAAEDSPPAQAAPRVQPSATLTAAELAALKEQTAIAGCPRSDAGQAPRGNSLPALTLPCLAGGRPVHLAGLRGIPMVVNVWAQWCGPCREEIPLFQQLHERSSGQLRVLGIDLQDPNIGMALAFAAETGMTYPQLQDLDGAVPDALRVRGIPLTVFVAADGRVAYTQQGVVDSARELRALVEKHLGVSTR
jgi:thiol-disulfide isomerase/thioredoxin